MQLRGHRTAAPRLTWALVCPRGPGSGQDSNRLPAPRSKRLWSRSSNTTTSRTEKTLNRTLQVQTRSLAVRPALRASHQGPATSNSRPILEYETSLRRDRAFETVV